MVSVIGMYVHDDFNSTIRDELTLSNGSVNTYATDVLDETTAAYSNVDKSYVIIIAVLFIALIATAIMIPTPPVFFAISLILLIFLIIFAGVLANVYSEFIDDDDINATATDIFPILTHIMTNYPTWTFAFFVVFVLAMYAKTRFI